MNWLDLFAHGTIVTAIGFLAYVVALVESRERRQRDHEALLRELLAGLVSAVEQVAPAIVAERERVSRLLDTLSATQGDLLRKNGQGEWERVGLDNADLREPLPLKEDTA